MRYSWQHELRWWGSLYWKLFCRGQGRHFVPTAMVSRECVCLVRFLLNSWSWISIRTLVMQTEPVQLWVFQHRVIPTFGLGESQGRRHQLRITSSCHCDILWPASCGRYHREMEDLRKAQRKKQKTLQQQEEQKQAREVRRLWWLADDMGWWPDDS